MTLIDILRTEWAALTELQQGIALALSGLVLLALLLWRVAASRSRRFTSQLALAERERDRQEMTLSAREERLAAQDAEIDAREAELGESRAAHATASREAAQRAETIRHLEDRIERLEEAHATLEASHEDLRGRHGALQQEHSRLQADTDGKLAAAAEERARLIQLREEMTRTFQELASATLRRTGEDLTKTQTERLQALLDPFKADVGRFEAEFRKVQEDAAKDRVRLKTEIEQLSRRSEEVSREAVALTNALKGEKQKQGAWGEMLLETILEGSGLRRGTEFETQATHVSEEGRRLRPDAVVRLPGGRCVVIDSKVSLVAYEAATNAEMDEDRAAHIRAHAAAVEKHVADLAGRDYSGAVEGAVDYTLMFLPVEPALALALEAQPDLTARAIGRRVAIATPTTLMLALRTIEHVWSVDTRQRNAEEIARRAGRLYDKVVGFADNMKKVGDHLDSATKVHGQAWDQLARGSGNLLRQTEMLKTLGARTNKALNVDHDDDTEDDDPPPPAALSDAQEAAE